MLKMVGCVVQEPLTGHWTRSRGKIGGKAYRGSAANCAMKGTDFELRDSVFIGVSVDFIPNDGAKHVAVGNLFFGGFECRTQCPITRNVKFGGGSNGTLVVVLNWVSR